MTSWRVGLSSGYVAATILHAYFPMHVRLLDYATTSQRKIDKITNWELLRRAMKHQPLDLSLFQHAVNKKEFCRVRRKTTIPSKKRKKEAAGGQHRSLLTHDDLVAGIIAGLHPGYAVSVLEGLHYYVSVTCGLVGTVSTMKRVSNINMSRQFCMPSSKEEQKQMVVVSMRHETTWNEELHSFCRSKLMRGISKLIAKRKEQKKMRGSLNWFLLSNHSFDVVGSSRKMQQELEKMTGGVLLEQTSKPANESLLERPLDQNGLCFGTELAMVCYFLKHSAVELVEEGEERWTMLWKKVCNGLERFFQNGTGGGTKSVLLDRVSLRYMEENAICWGKDDYHPDFIVTDDTECDVQGRKQDQRW